MDQARRSDWTKIAKPSDQAGSKTRLSQLHSRQSLHHAKPPPSGSLLLERGFPSPSSVTYSAPDPLVHVGQADGEGLTSGLSSQMVVGIIGESSKTQDCSAEHTA